MLKRWVPAVAVLLASLHLQAECKPGFVSAEKVLSTSVWSAVYGDFDGDGRVDIALQAIYDTRLVFLNRGNRVFQPVNRVNVGGSFSDPIVAAIDVNGDGALDLVYRGSSSIEVALGRGNGEFGSLIASPATFAREWRLVDINGDGRKDFVDYFSGQVSAELSLGDGHFATHTLASAPVGQNDQFAVGDFDGDGFPDLYVAGLSFTGGTAFHQWIFWNDGKGGFPTHTEVVTPGSHVPEMMLDAFDFDGDGAADILLRDDSGTKILRGLNRSLTLQPIVVADALLNAGSTPFSGLGDFDGDGHSDALFQNGAVVWGPRSAARIDGSFFDVVDGTATSGAFNNGAQVADVNADGIADIAGTGGGAGIFVVYGKPHSRALEGGTVVPGAGQNTGFATADVNGDGLTDVVISLLTSADIVTYLADGKGGFSPLPKQSLGGSESGAVRGLGDFDGDGKPDLLYQQGSDTKVLFGDGTGKFSNPVTYPNATATGTAHMGKSSADAAVVVSGGNVQLLSFSADRSFSATSIFPAPQNGNVFAVDADNDGVTDLLVTQYLSSTAQLVKKTSNGWAAATQIAGVPLLGVSKVAVGDVDGDGRRDIVTCDETDSCSLSLATASGYAAGEAIPSGLFFLSGLAIADMDHDGRAEIITLWRGNFGDPLVLTSVRYRGPGHFDAVDVANTNAGGSFFLADVDGDGAIDAVVLSFSGLDVLRNGCKPSSIHAALSEPNPSAGERPTLVVNVEPSFDFAGLVTLKEGSATLATGQPDLFGDYATVLFTLPALTAGVHVYTITYDDEFSGHAEETFPVTVLSPQPRKRAVHH